MKRQLARVLAVAALALPLVFAGQASADPVGGAKDVTDDVLAHSTNSYRVVCRGDDVTSVIVRGDGDTDLDLYVYDLGGHLIASDTDYTDECVVTFTPAWTGTFFICVVNRGSVYNHFSLLVD